MGLFDFLGNIGGSAMSGAFSLAAANAQYQNQRKLNEQAYDLTQRGYKESPTAQRQGLEAAGYNPILAVNSGTSFGSYSSGSASMASTPDFATGMSNISNAKVTKQKSLSEIKNIEAGTNATNASASLATEQAKTEQYRQKQLESETALNHINEQIAEYDKQLRKKDLDYYDQRWALEQKERLTSVKTMLINAQANHMMSEADQLNAHTAQADYRLRKGITDYENVYRKALADFYTKHPGFVTYEKYGGEIGKNIRDIGVGVGSVFAGKSFSKVSSNGNKKTSSKRKVFVKK